MQESATNFVGIHMQVSFNRGLPVFQNLCRNVIATKPNMVWMSDITTKPRLRRSQQPLIGVLYDIEREARGRAPDERRSIRQARAGPFLEGLHQWLQSSLSAISAKSELAITIRYALVRSPTLTRYVADERIEINNNAAERALRSGARTTCSQVPTPVVSGRRRSTACWAPLN